MDEGTQLGVRERGDICEIAGNSARRWVQQCESAASGATVLMIVRRWCGDAAVSATVGVMVTVRERAENIRLKPSTTWLAITRDTVRISGRGCSEGKTRWQRNEEVVTRDAVVSALQIFCQRGVA